MKKRTVFILIFALLISIITPTADAQAAVSLSKKKVILEVGATINLKMNGTKSAVTWKSNNTKVATVSKGKVTAVATGTAKITATVAKKNYVCVVNVVDSSKKIADEFSEKAVIKKLKATKLAVISNKYSTYFIISIKNGSDYNIRTDVTVDLLDKKGNSVGIKTAYLYDFAAGDEKIISIMTDTEMAVTNYKLSYTAKEVTDITSLEDSVEASAKLSGNNVIITATNNGYSCARDVEVFLLCYKDGKVCDYVRANMAPAEHDGDYLNPGETAKVSRYIYDVDSVKVINVTGYRYR